jgi:CheY-like chemotaxis protein
MEASNKIREHERNFGLPRTPIIAFVVHVMPGDIESITSRGQMDGHILKPIRSQELIETVQRHGRLGRSAAGNDVHEFLASISRRTEARTYAALSFKAMI